ncbi:MAG: ABC transporter permease subunit [Armatimonadota bacterium]|nr:ABC transporter permease subunit [Armatimonadota bacterium]
MRQPTPDRQATPPSRRAGPPPWRNARILAAAAQVVVLAAVAGGLWAATLALRASFARQNIRLDWGVFTQPAGFELSALTVTLDLQTLHLKPFEPTDSNAEAIIAGLFNTVQVAVVGVVLATALGVLVGVARLSRNWLVARLSLAYVEALRNTPLLVQLFFWYFAVFLQLPDGSPARPPLRAGPVTLTNSGLAVGGQVVERFGRLVVDGGYQLPPELAALVIGLAVYTSAFIGEIVRGGILAVPRGQMEAARSLGLTYGQALRHVVLPQAFRIVIPPLGNQFLNLTKNSSLAIGIGYAELLTAANTVSSQSFRSLEAFTVVTLAYLALSLSIAAALNLVRARLALPGTL